MSPISLEVPKPKNNLWVATTIGHQGRNPSQVVNQLIMQAKMQKRTMVRHCQGGEKWIQSTEVSTPVTLQTKFLNHQFKLCYTLESCGELLKIPLILHTSKIRMSKVGARCPWFLKVPRWLQCASKFQNHCPRLYCRKVSLNEERAQ